MKRTYKQIDEEILNYVIDFLQEHTTSELYNERICRGVGISRHTLQNHYENLGDIFEQLKMNMSSILAEISENSSDFDNYIKYTLTSLKEHEKCLNALKKIDSRFIEKEKEIMFDKYHSSFIKKYDCDEGYWISLLLLYGISGVGDKILELKSIDNFNQICELLYTVASKINHMVKRKSQI